MYIEPQFSVPSAKSLRVTDNNTVWCAVLSRRVFGAKTAKSAPKVYRIIAADEVFGGVSFFPFAASLLCCVRRPAPPAGASSTKALLPFEKRGITKARGEWADPSALAQAHGGALAGKRVMPWFHPSYLIRNAGERSRQEGGVRWHTRNDLREVKNALVLCSSPPPGGGAMPSDAAEDDDSSR